jgi:hypothetical protein
VSQKPLTKKRSLHDFVGTDASEEYSSASVGCSRKHCCRHKSETFEHHVSVQERNGLYHSYMLADAGRRGQQGREDITTETEQLTGVASSSRRRFSAEHDSRIGRTSSNERVSPRLTIPTVRMEIRLIEVSHEGSAHRQHERLRLSESR